MWTGSKDIGDVATPVSISKTTIEFPEINTDVAAPKDTPIVSVAPVLAIPLNTPKTNAPKPQLQNIPNTPDVVNTPKSE